MYENNNYRIIPWNPSNHEDINTTKKAILAIIKSQNVSLSKVRYLFNDIIQDIEDNNVITL